MSQFTVEQMLALPTGQTVEGAIFVQTLRVLLDAVDRQKYMNDPRVHAAHHQLRQFADVMESRLRQMYPNQGATP
jgi:hypothetical protein